MDRQNELLQDLTATMRTWGSAPGHAQSPFVTLSFAQTLDGCLAVAYGERLFISGVESQTLTHRLRASHEGILIGVGTVLADDPLLTVRLVSGTDPQRIIVDPKLRTPLSARILNDGAAPPWIVTLVAEDDERAHALRARGVTLIHTRGRDGWIPVASLLKSLRASGIRSLMVEGGAVVISTFLAAGLANFAVITMGPLIIGSSSAVRYTPERPYILKNMNSGRAGTDLVYWGLPTPIDLSLRRTRVPAAADAYA